MGRAGPSRGWTKNHVLEVATTAVPSLGVTKCHQQPLTCPTSVESCSGRELHSKIYHQPSTIDWYEPICTSSVGDHKSTHLDCCQSTRDMEIARGESAIDCSDADSTTVALSVPTVTILSIHIALMAGTKMSRVTQRVRRWVHHRGKQTFCWI